MVPSLFVQCAEKVRRSWSLYDEEYRRVAFDILWMHRTGGAYPIEFEALCRDDTSTEICLKDPLSYGPLRLRRLCETLGLYPSVILKGGRLLIKVTKPREWNWEFTSRNPGSWSRYRSCPSRLRRPKIGARVHVPRASRLTTSCVLL